MNYNIGWLYYKYYYKDLASGRSNFKAKFELLKQARITDIVRKKGAGKYKLELTTLYPGLLIGSGTGHESGDKEKDNELKLGFSFDYTTGLPLIPGSSIKGLLRSMFPLSVKKGKTLSQEDELEKNYRMPRREYIKSILIDVKEEDEKEGDVDLLKKAIQELDIDLLEKIIFEGINATNTKEYLPIYERDIFFDAFPISSIRGLLDNDYITPHIKEGDPMSVFKNPKPIQFLKVLPNVTFEFRFDLEPTRIGDMDITAEDKKKLFEAILLDIGIGAKTNVGYGQFTDKPSINTNQPNTRKILKKKNS